MDTKRIVLNLALCTCGTRVGAPSFAPRFIASVNAGIVYSLTDLMFDNPACDLTAVDIRASFAPV